MSANLHGGSLVANYPFDDSANGQVEYSKSPDDALFKELALTYSNAHPVMNHAKPCPGFPAEKFKNGITNGAQWYVVRGGMQDFNYVHSNCFEITVEMGCTKFPQAVKLHSYWDAHKLPLILFMTQVHKGVRGFVMSDEGKPLKRAVIRVSGINHMVFTADDGDYWRLLLPGSYNITAGAHGYSSETKQIIVPYGLALVANFTLKAINKTPALSHVPVQIGQQQSDTAMTTKPTPSAKQATTKSQYMPGKFILDFTMFQKSSTNQE